MSTSRFCLECGAAILVLFGMACLVPGQTPGDQGPVGAAAALVQVRSAPPEGIQCTNTPAPVSSPSATPRPPTKAPSATPRPPTRTRTPTPVPPTATPAYTPVPPTVTPCPPGAPDCFGPMACTRCLRGVPAADIKRALDYPWLIKDWHCTTCAGCRCSGANCVPARQLQLLDCGKAYSPTNPLVFKCPCK